MPNDGIIKYIKRYLKGEIDKKTKMVEDFNTLLSATARSSRKLKGDVDLKIK